MPAWLGGISVGLLSLYLAVSPALAAWGAWIVKPRGETHFASPSYLLAFAALWILTEWLRSWIFTGFAWSPLGVIAVPHAAVPARWVGTYGMSGIVFLLAGVLILTLFRLRVAPTALFGGVLFLWGAAFVSHLTGRAIGGASGREQG